MEPEPFKEMQDDTRSRYDGLGLVVSTQTGVLAVVTPIDGGRRRSPASSPVTSS